MPTNLSKTTSSLTHTLSHTLTHRVYINIHARSPAYLNSVRVDLGIGHHTLQHTATHCNALQHTATHCTTLHHTAAHCNTLQHTATHTYLGSVIVDLVIVRSHTATHSNTLQHTATHCNTLQHTHTLTVSELTFESAIKFQLSLIGTSIRCLNPDGSSLPWKKKNDQKEHGKKGIVYWWVYLCKHT